MSANIHIVCSDRPRNGKTLLARLYADMLLLRDAPPAHVFDTAAPGGGIAAFYPGEAEIVDLARTEGQMRLFDTILSNPETDYVVDLAAHHLKSFFSVWSMTGFEAAAAEAGLGSAVFFMLDTSLSSVAAARETRKEIREGQFVIVRNMAITKPLNIRYTDRDFRDIGMDRDITFPTLSSGTLDMVQQPDFSFRDFVDRKHQTTSPLLRDEIWRFLKTIFDQRPPPERGRQFLI